MLGAKFVELNIVDLFPIINDDGMRYAKVANNVSAHENCDLCIGNGSY